MELNGFFYIQDLFEHGEELKAKYLERKMGKWEVIYVHISRKCRERNAERLLREAEMPHTRT